MRDVEQYNCDLHKVLRGIMATLSNIFERRCFGHRVFLSNASRRYHYKYATGKQEPLFTARLSEFEGTVAK